MVKGDLKRGGPHFLLDPGTPSPFLPTDCPVPRPAPTVGADRRVRRSAPTRISTSVNVPTPATALSARRGMYFVRPTTSFPPSSSADDEQKCLSNPVKGIHPRSIDTQNWTEVSTRAPVLCQLVPTLLPAFIPFESEPSCIQGAWGGTKCGAVQGRGAWRRCWWRARNRRGTRRSWRGCIATGPGRPPKGHKGTRGITGTRGGTSKGGGNRVEKGGCMSVPHAGFDRKGMGRGVVRPPPCGWGEPHHFGVLTQEKDLAKMLEGK